MKFPFYFLFFLGLFCFSLCKHSRPDIILTGNISNDVNALLKEGTTEVQIMDSIVQTPREMELSYRMQQAVEKNKDWYQEWATHYRQLRVLPYHPNFGMSEAEYKELMDMKLNKNVVPSSTQNISVSNANGLIQFNSKGKIPYLDNLKINTKENTVSMDNFTLHFTDTIFVANENHALKSMWKGYVWRYDEPAENDTTSDGANAKHYSITLAQLYKTGNTLLIISRLEDTEWERTLNFEKALILRKD
jgi:hypothetical protein